MLTSQWLFTLSAVLVVTPASSGDELPASLDPDTIRAIAVQHDGRWPPLDTLARDIVESVTGDAFHLDRDPVLMLLGWTFDPPRWKHQPLISIPNAELRAELQLPDSQTDFSYDELLNHARLRELIADLARAGRGRKLDPLESKVNDIHDKLGVLSEVFGGRVIRPIPDPADAVGTWQPIVASAPHGGAAAEPVTEAWDQVKQAFLDDDATAFGAAGDRLVAALAALPAAHRPDPRLIATELRYNRLRPFRTAWMVMLIGAGLAVAATIIRRKWFDVVAVLGMLAGFGLLTFGLSLRWQIAGRIPAANMFESLLFLSWGMGVFAVLSMIFLRHRVVPLTASAMGALALILADLLPLDHYVRPIVPVLMDTVWMSIHVPVIMVSYSVLALAVLIAHAQLVVMAAVPGRRRLAGAIDTLHYWYVLVGSLLLLAGIVTGSMWAASSWGRYWGWDPKEVWSLVAFVGYMAILHVRVNHGRVPGWAYAAGAVLGIALFVMVVPRMAPVTAVKLLALGAAAVAMVFFVLARGRFAIAVKSILAFWMIIMTYVGVNYLLGIGLHSYGFGTGAVARKMFWVGGTDLALVLLCAVVYLARRPPQLTPAPITAPPAMGL